MSCDAGKDIHKLIDDLRNKSCGSRGEAADAIERLLVENEQLRFQLEAAKEDLSLLDSCEVCRWGQEGSCKNNGPQFAPRCFEWRGTEKKRQQEV